MGVDGLSYLPPQTILQSNVPLKRHLGNFRILHRYPGPRFSCKGWKIIKKAEEYLGCSLIESRSGGATGGSSHLTPEAKDLLARHLGMEKELKAATAQLFETYFGDYPYKSR